MDTVSKLVLPKDIQCQPYRIDQTARSALKKQEPICIWLTGLSGAGKSTLAEMLDQRLHDAGRHSFVLDGDNVRNGLSSDLGFGCADRAENIRRVAEVARLMVNAGLIVVVSLISPFRLQREQARKLFASGEFVEVFVDTSLATCEQRDVKGLYAKARRGELPQFTGIDSPYEPPINPELHLQCEKLSPSTCVDRLLKILNIQDNEC